MIRTTCTLAAVAMLAGCSDGTPTLMNISKQGRAPDEFSILPSKPLEAPESFTALPPPTPGQGNRADRQPLDEAVAALGGNAARGVGGDSALLAATGRYGRQGDIRAVLAAEDLEYRRVNDGRLLERAFGVNVYYKAYRPQSLDQHAELARLRRAGVRTVAAPPDPEAR